MIDFNTGYADFTHKFIEAERLENAGKRKWLHELRLLERADRKQRGRGERTVIISQPEHLRGLHKVWF
jgi:hypothetical protein